MPFSLNFSFSLELWPTKGSHCSGEIMSDNWAAEKARMLHKRTEDASQREAVLLENRRLIDEQAPALWEELRRQIESRCESLNREFRSRIVFVMATPNDELDVEFRHDGKVSRLHAAFKITTGADALKWSYSGSAQAQGAHSDSYQVYPNREGIVAFCRAASSTSPEDIAQDMIEGLLKESE